MSLTRFVAANRTNPLLLSALANPPKRKSVKYNQRLKMWVAQNGLCFYCLNPVKLKKSTIDHKTPLSKGGQNKPENKVIACHRCNKLKGSMNMQDFLILMTRIHLR